MPQLEQIFTLNFLSLALHRAIVYIYITDDFPIVARITHAVVAEARHLLPLTQRRPKSLMRVQVLARLRMLQPNNVAAEDRLSRPTGPFEALCISYSP